MEGMAPLNPLNLEEVCRYVNETITVFHQHRLASLSRLTLAQLLHKNPYLFRAKNITRAADLIDGTMTAFLSSSEEKLFGDFLEDLAIFVAEGQDMRPAIEVGMRWWGRQPNPPMNNVMYVSGFYPPDFLISIEAVAVVPA